MKHTPGPWTAGITGKNDKYMKENLIVYGTQTQQGYEGAIVCSVAPKGHITTEDMANARLIAAAPEMLELLKEQLPWLKEYIEEAGPCDHSVNICICGLIRQAEAIQEIISKIEGD